MNQTQITQIETKIVEIKNTLQTWTNQITHYQTTLDQLTEQLIEIILKENITCVDSFTSETSNGFREGKDIIIKDKLKLNLSSVEKEIDAWVVWNISSIEKKIHKEEKILQINEKIILPPRSKREITVFLKEFNFEIDISANVVISGYATPHYKRPAMTIPFQSGTIIEKSRSSFVPHVRKLFQNYSYLYDEKREQKIATYNISGKMEGIFRHYIIKEDAPYSYPVYYQFFITAGTALTYLGFRDFNFRHAGSILLQKGKQLRNSETNKNYLSIQPVEISDESDEELIGDQAQLLELQIDNQRTQKEEEQTNQDQIKPNLKKLIGRGGYGEVYYGEWKSQEVAVKKLYLVPHDVSDSELENIQKEIGILKNLRNRYIIQYYETYSDDQELLIIMDYAENGNLTKFINDNKDKEHDWSFNVKLIKQIALGLTYIHHEKIIHRDLKSMNILLAHGYQAKISDFGLSKTKTISSSHSKNSPAGTVRWMAPEVIEEQKYSEQSDIYSLGMIIWEIVTKCTMPFKDFDNDFSVMFQVAHKNKREVIPFDAPKNIHYIIKQCWKDDPSERITLKKILEVIESNKLDMKLTNNSLLEEQGLSLDTRNKTSQEESKSVKLSRITEEPNLLQKKMLCSDPTELDNQNWQNLHSSFTSEQITQWQELGFNFNQCKEWLDTGLKENEAKIASYLRDTKHLTPETVLNHANYEQLREEYRVYQEQLETQQEQPPKKGL